MKAKEFIPAEKPRNFVAKNAKMGGAGAHKDKKKAEKQGDVKHKNKEYAENVEEGWKDKVAAAGLAGAMAFGASGASARVMPGDDPGINRLTGKPIAAQQATDNAPAKAEAPKGFSKEYLQAVVDGKHPRPMISVEKAKELLKNMSEGVADEGVLSFLKTEPEKKKWNPAKDSRVTGNKQDNNGWIKLLIDKHRRGIELTDREWNSIEQWKLKRAMGSESAQFVEQDMDEARMSPQVKLQRAWEREQAKSAASRKRGQELLNPPTKQEPEKKYGQQSVAERTRDPEDWDEGNTEPANNFAVYINGKKWKVFKGRGRYADDNREQAHYQQLKDWAAKKSADTGKKWTVSITGEAPTE